MRATQTNCSIYNRHGRLPVLHHHLPGFGFDPLLLSIAPAKADGEKTVILGFDNVSRRYKYNDLSWLWDVEFELLNDESITHVVLIGRFKWDVRVRLKYARVPDKKIVMLDNMDDFVKTILEETKGDIYTMVCFDMTAILLNKIKEYQDGNN